MTHRLRNFMMVLIPTILFLSSTAWSALPRFVDMSDGTVVDTVSNLRWTKNGNCFSGQAYGGIKMWDDAVSSCSAMASGQCGLSDGSAPGDWHLPTLDELRTFVDAGYRTSTLNSSGFTNVAGGSFAYYWSSNTNQYYSQFWMVHMEYGMVGVLSSNRYDWHYAWPVRSVQFWALDPFLLSGRTSFSPQSVGTLSLPYQLELVNSASGNQTITSIALTGADADQFSIASSSCSSLAPTLSGGEKCTLNLNFAPTSKGAKTANLAVQVSGQSFDVPVSGSGLTTISGSVIDMASKTAVSGATVTITGGASTTTDAGGAFNFASPPGNGTYAVTVSKPGYASTSVNGVVVSDTRGAVLTLGMVAPGSMNIVSPSAMLYGEIGKPLDFPLPISGGTAPFVLSKAYGTLPPGITLNSAGISGTPTTAGSYVFAITVTDHEGAYAEQEFTATVTAPLTIGTASILPRGVKGVPYATTVDVSGGAAPYTFALLHGALPAGLTLNSSTGAISGTLPANASGAAFTLRVTDSVGLTATGNFSLPVDAPLDIATTRLDDAIIGSASSSNLTASGGFAPYTWSLFSGRLPSGLSLSSSGVISGTPTSATTEQVVLSVTDATGRVVYRQFTLNALNPLQILTTTMPNAHLGDAYSELIRTSGGIGPFTYGFTGLLPAGLTLNPSTGIISGTPSSAGFVNLTLTVTDSSFPTPQNVTQTLGVRTTSQMTITSGTVLPTARMGNALNPVTLTVAGGTSPYTWSVVSGALPAGVSLDPSTGTLSGTPTQAGDFIFTVRLADSVGTSTGTVSNPDKQMFLHVSAPLVVNTAVVPTGGVGIPYAATLEASGGMRNYTWGIISGTLPAGLALNSATGVISGTPTAKISSSNVTFRVIDSDTPPQEAQKDLTFAIRDNLSIQEATVPIGRVSQAYTTSIHAWLGTTPYTWRVSAGALPGGLTLTQNAGVATISGNPTTAGSYSFTLEVSDSSPSPQTVTQGYTVNVYHPIVIGTWLLPNVRRTVPYYALINASGGLAPLRYSIVGGSLPQGLSINAQTGAISGTAPAVTSQSSNFTVRVTDSGVPADYQDKDLSIVVVDPVPVNGVCGDINGGYSATAPTASLCKFGTPSASGAWSWECTGQYGGTTASCSVTYGYPLSVTVAGTGSGTVTSDAVATGIPSDISCIFNTCSAGYPNTSVVTLVATPDSLSRFAGWSGSCAASPCILTMDSPKAVTATFAPAHKAMVGTAGFSTLASAYLEAAKSASATIKTLDTKLVENLTMDQPVAIALQGGWRATYTGLSGVFTVLEGKLTISRGSLTVERFVIK